MSEEIIKKISQPIKMIKEKIKTATITSNLFTLN